MAAKPIADGYTCEVTITGVDGKEYAFAYRPMLGARRMRLYAGVTQLSLRGWQGMQAAAKATCEAIADHLISLSVDGKPMPVSVDAVDSLEPDVLESLENYVTRISLPPPPKEDKTAGGIQGGAVSSTDSQEETDAKN